jgi:hypothetical protein
MDRVEFVFRRLATARQVASVTAAASLVFSRDQYKCLRGRKSTAMPSNEITEEAAMPRDVPEPETDELFEMANLFARTTGLPMTVWVSPRGNARHDVRVKANMTHGN